jgi:glycosyltransferase involved in cell wall biosynthesis
MKLPITVIILTYNEEKNIEECLKSIHGFFEEIFIVDSFSTDKTIEIAKKYTDKIYQHEFENYSSQRNWALNNLPIRTEWVLNLDADHRVTKELIDELKEIFSKGLEKNFNGFLISRKTIFMGKWIKYGGHYPVYHAILFRKNSGRCEKRLYDQHFVVNGKLKKLKSDVIDIVADSIDKFISKHIKWAYLEAKEQMIKREKDIKPSLFGNPIQKRRFFREIYNKFPLFIRPFLYFIYRYFLRFGFLDGIEGLIFHFLHALWYRFIVDVKIYELKKYGNNRS